MKNIAKYAISVLNGFGFNAWNRQSKRRCKALRLLG
jgi:hypothetical protein